MFSIGYIDPLPLLKRKSFNVDSFGILMHSRISTLLFITCGIVMTGYKIFRSPISCSNNNKMMNEFLQSYCWTMSTSSNAENHQDDLHPYLGFTDGDQVFHSYYQWSTVIFIILALISRLPHYIWKYFEGNLIRNLTMDAEDHLKLSHEEKMNSYLKMLTQYFKKNVNSRRHRAYGYCFFVCEVLNICSVFVLVVILEYLLNGGFLDLGVGFVRFHFIRDIEENPTTKVFPLISRCVLKRFGPSGSPENLEETCVLIMNLINKQVYIIIWFWLAFVFCILVMSFIYCLLTVFCKSERSRQMSYITGCNPKYSGLANRISFGDYVILTLLLKHFQVPWGARILEDVSTGISDMTISTGYWTDKHPTPKALQYLGEDEEEGRVKPSRADATCA